MNFFHCFLSVATVLLRMPNMAFKRAFLAVDALRHEIFGSTCPAISNIGATWAFCVCSTSTKLLAHPGHMPRDDLSNRYACGPR